MKTCWPLKKAFRDGFFFYFNVSTSPSADKTQSTLISLAVTTLVFAFSFSSLPLLGHLTANSSGFLVFVTTKSKLTGYGILNQMKMKMSWKGDELDLLKLRM